METKYFVVSNFDCDSIAIIQLVDSDFNTFNSLFERSLKEHFIEYEKIKFNPIDESIFSHEIELDCFENEEDRISTSEKVTLTQTELYKPETETAEVFYSPINNKTMIVNDKMTKAEILGHYNLSQELLNNTTKYSEQYKNALSESLKERATLKQKVFDLERDCETLKKKIKEIVFNQVAKLEAVKMLFSITSAAHTHRSKAMFSDQAKQMIDEEIKTTQHNAGFFNLHDGLPF